ncbi:MAG: hypothetical protein KDK34_19805, partial [Leptospiraceae bacterium]|nr:hypothetical protein [Leptospiraceae bacterium]
MMGENFLSGYSGGNLAMDNILYGGFGEIGNYGMRPSGLQMGFYPQLQLAAMFQADGERKSMNKASATVDPVATIVNQYNPLVMLANAQKNVELAHVDGKDRGYMWEAQLLDMTKSGMSAIAGLVSAIPIVGPVIGSVIQFMASSIKVDPTTGDRLFRSDDEAAIAAASVLLGGSLLTAGMEYDEEGRSQGWNGDKAVEQGTLDIIGALLGGGLVSDFISNSYHITKEYEKARAGKDSNYLYYQNVGLGRLGTLGGMIISQEAQKSSAFKKAYDQWKGNKESMVDYANNGPKPGDPARGTTYNLFAGIAAHFANNESTYKKIGGFLNPFSKQGLGQYLHALGAESVGNYLMENI